MDCRLTSWTDEKGFLEGFFRKVQAERTPLSGSVEITRRCNLRCTHCYIDLWSRASALPGEELDTDEWRCLIDEMGEGGCLFLLMTGGEPLLRKDFPDIYRHARQSGLVVTVFTNGTLVDERLVELFMDLPPSMVEISLYGASAEVYERITGVEGSFERCVAGIRKLLEARVETRLKTILMTYNCHEFNRIEALAEDLGARFRFDPLITPRFDGDRRPLGLRVSPARAVDLEFCDEQRSREWVEFYRTRPEHGPDERVYPCGAGLTGFHIDPQGVMQPCLMTAGYGCDARRPGGFGDGWRRRMPILRQKRLGHGSRCRDCDARPVCGYCPPFFELETGSETKPPDYICDIGRLRLQAVRARMPREELQ